VFPADPEERTLCTMMSRPPEGQTRFAVLLETALDEKSWSKQDLAVRVPVSRGAIYNWLRGDTPSADMCFSIARALDMNPLRILEACNYAPGVSGLLDLVEQLRAHNEQLAESRTRVDPTRSQSGLGLVVDEFSKVGGFAFRVVPWWRGTGSNRRHYADFIAIDAPEADNVTQQGVEAEFGDVLALAMSWWEGEENWGHVLTGRTRPQRADLVLNIPRFVANRRAESRTDLSAPQTIVLIGGHWCGQAEAGRFLADLLDYDYALPSLAASVMHRTLVQRWNEPSWDRDRLDLVRTFALSTPISRRRVWAVDFWDDADAVKVVATAPNVPFIILLEPSDALMEYAADRRRQDGHARDGRSRDADLALLKRVRSQVKEALVSVRPDQLMVVPVDVVDGAWEGRGLPHGRALPLVDEWLDHFAGTAQRIFNELPRGVAH
jgi:transcriptional regulator with XRE-family HTH domain